MAVGYDDESIAALERAIAQATAAGVSKENIEKAKQLLNSLYEGRQLLNETLVTLQNAIRTRSLAQLREAVNTASEIGFHNAQLNADLIAARKIISSISKEGHEKSLAECIENATVDNHDDLANAVESSRDSSLSSVVWVRAQAVQRIAGGRRNRVRAAGLAGGHDRRIVRAEARARIGCVQPVFTTRSRNPERRSCRRVA